MTPEEEKVMAESITLHEDARDAGAKKMYDGRIGDRIGANNEARIQGLDNALAAPIDAQLQQLENAAVAAPVAAVPAAPSTSNGDVGVISASPAVKAAMPTTSTAPGAYTAPPSSAPAAPVTHPSGGAPIATSTPVTHDTGVTFTEIGAATAPAASATPTPSASPVPEPASTHNAAAPAPHSDGGAPIATTAAYTVVKGDTLSGIAAAHHMSLAEVESLNPQIKNPNLILPGETVHLSANMPTSSSYGSIVDSTSTSGGGPAVLENPSMSKKGLLGGIFGRFGKGGSTDGTTPPADPARTIAEDSTKSAHHSDKA